MRALLSVANRDGIVELARALLELGLDVVATDGTRDYLATEGITVESVSSLTQGEPDVGGQVKTFHHGIYAGILARRDVSDQLDELEAQGIGLIDVVVVNVKPFAPAIGVALIGLDEAIEMIDVAGAALLGAAARNAAGVAAVADPEHYPQIISEIRELGVVKQTGGITETVWTMTELHGKEAPAPPPLRRNRAEPEEEAFIPLDDKVALPHSSRLAMQ